MEISFYNKEKFPHNRLPYLTFEEWVEENIFLIHEVNYSELAQQKLSNDIWSRCHIGTFDQEIKSSFGDVIRLRGTGYSNSMFLEINGQNIYPDKLLK